MELFTAVCSFNIQTPPVFDSPGAIGYLSGDHSPTEARIEMLFFRRLPLSQKILLGLVPLFLLFVAASVMLQNQFQEREMLEEAQTAAHTYADIVRESLVSMMVNNLEVDSSFIERVNMLQQFDTLRVFVNNLHLREELLTPQRQERLEVKYRTLRPRDDIDKAVLASGQPFFVREGDVFRGVVPFNATTVCQNCHAVPVGYTLGATNLRISFARVSRVAEGNWRRSSLIFFLFAGLVIAMATIMFRRFVSAPVDRLVHATDEMSRGNLRDPVPGAAAGSATGDELAVLAARFEEMRLSLSDKIGQLDQANRQLSERNLETQDALDRLRRAQEDLVRNERLAVTGRMMAQLSHEINNPIHNIQSLLQSSVKRLAGDERTRELVAVAMDEVVRMARLTRQMLDFYRGSVTELERDIVDMGALLTEVARMYREPLRESGIAVRVELAPALPPVRGSRDKLKQVLINLVVNARDAIPAGAPEGYIRLAACAAAQNVRIDVADNGVGIAPDRIDRVFDAFYTTKREVSGVGLGLSVSHEIVRQHNGTITVESTAGVGTTFTILLPGADDGNDSTPAA